MRLAREVDFAEKLNAGGSRGFSTRDMTEKISQSAALSRALGRGDYVTAQRLLQAIILIQPNNPSLQQALGVVEIKLGRSVEALYHLQEAVRLAPLDARIRNSLANLLDAIGNSHDAIKEYQAAIALDAEYLDPQLNLGITYRSIGQYAAAAATLQQCTQAAPQSASAWRHLALTQLDLGNLPAAKVALDRALRLDPNNIGVLEARARAESDTGGDALPLYHRARELDPDSSELVLGQATALHRAGHGADAIQLLRSFMTKHSNWRAGLAALAQLRWQWGEADFLCDYRVALEQRSASSDTILDYISALCRSGRYADVLVVFNKFSLPRHRLIEAAAASEVGDFERADRTFQDVEQRGVKNSVARIRHLLRTRQYQSAAQMAEVLVTGGDATAWPYLASSWRLTQDPRARSVNDANFIKIADLRDSVDLAALIPELRETHVGQRAPFDQTVRGGHQSDGNLFDREAKATVDLRKAAESAVANYIARLPPVVDGHPLLARHRDGFRFAGSWSVRLTAGGFHTSHTHTNGWISSAFYVLLPPSTMGSDGDGWLVLGEAPSELSLDLPSIARICPEPGKLVLFPSYIWHRTTPFPSGERITAAFDVLPS